MLGFPKGVMGTYCISDEEAKQNWIKVLAQFLKNLAEEKKMQNCQFEIGKGRQAVLTKEEIEDVEEFIYCLLNCELPENDGTPEAYSWQSRVIEARTKAEKMQKDIVELKKTLEG